MNISDTSCAPATWAGARPFLSRLARDKSGNTLFISAAALFPLLALVGSGIDMGRGYLAQARLQQACDAAALAGRRAMSSGVLDGTVTAEATKFFKFNFPIGTMGRANSAAFYAEPFTPVIGSAANSTVTVAAETKLPTTIMKLFGFETLPLSVSCYAKQDFVNTDVMLVLDTTGSMNDDVNGNNAAGSSSAKIAGLRNAVLALYDELKPIQDQLTSQGLRLRYGVVPYSSGVNVGKVVRAINPNYIVNTTWDYYSREATPTTSSRNSISESTCENNLNGSYNGSAKTCTYYPLSRRSLPVTDYVSGLSVPLLGVVGSSGSSTWAGCIEERATVTTITGSSGYTIPSGAKDLNVDLVPTLDKTTQWAPYWPDVVFRQDTGRKPQVACPVEAKRLQTWTRSGLSTYLNSLVPTGGTYHDNGMIWGTRMLSTGGVFAADNPTSFGSMPVNRYIIFMTDGITDTGDTIYHTYGMERWDKRITGGWTGETDSNNRHRQRFKMMCNAAKGMNISIWVVAFASALDSDLVSCASSESQASTSANAAELTDKFVEIGKNIGALRLVQ